MPRLVVTLTIRPQPWRIISGTIAFASVGGAVVWTATKRRHLIWCDLPELERPMPAVRPDCPRADAVVNENVDAAEPIAGGFGDLLGRGVVSQIRLDREEVGSLASLTCAGGECFQRPTISIDAGDLDACRQQSPRHCSADAPAAPVTIATLWVSVMACFPLCRPPSYFRF